MKTLFLAAACLLVCAGTLPAQSKPGERPASGSNPSDAGPALGEIVAISPGNLRDIVYGDLPLLLKNKFIPEADMPNFVMAKEVGDLELPGPLTLHRVSVVQAVALVAAAVGCSLEPICAPEEKADKTHTGAVIGYRITRDRAPKPGPGVVALPVAGGAAASAPARSPEEAERPVVRVYAVGAALHLRSSENPNRAETPGDPQWNEKELMDLVTDAVDKAKLGFALPEFSFHPASQALIVKAPAAQQEIVEQVLRALNENREHEARPATGARP